MHVCVMCTEGAKVMLIIFIRIYHHCTVSDSCTVSLLYLMLKQMLEPISDRVDRASATETVDSGSIPGRVIPKTIKIGIHSFPA